mgnify:CR=1 FL=1
MSELLRQVEAPSGDVRDISPQARLDAVNALHSRTLSQLTALVKRITERQALLNEELERDTTPDPRKEQIRQTLAALDELKQWAERRRGELNTLPVAGAVGGSYNLVDGGVQGTAGFIANNPYGRAVLSVPIFGAIIGGITYGGYRLIKRIFGRRAPEQPATTVAPGTVVQPTAVQPTVVRPAAPVVRPEDDPTRPFTVTT